MPLSQHAGLFINSPTEAVALARSLVGTGIYQLGTGNFNTPVGGKSDCAGFAFNRCYNIKRHRPGFNRGRHASVIDHLNCNSCLEDAAHASELFEFVNRPEIGALLAYPTFTSRGKRFIGHVGIVVDVPPEWPGHPLDTGGETAWEDLIVVQCCGPNGRNPGIIMSNGATWDRHDRLWPKPEHRSKLIRVKPEHYGKNVG